MQWRSAWDKHRLTRFRLHEIHRGCRSRSPCCQQSHLLRTAVVQRHCACGNHGLKHCRYWSTKRTGLEEGQLQVTGGALQPVMSVHLQRGTVLAAGHKMPAELKLLLASTDTPALLQGMQYREAKEVRSQQCACTNAAATRL